MTPQPEPVTPKWSPEIVQGSKRDPLVEIVTVTPAMAAEWLRRNPHNRNLSTTSVDRIVDDITNERFDGLNGQTFVIDEYGNLIDGQHRSTAIVKTGRSVRTIVVTVTSAVAQSTIDTGRPRALKDVLGMDKVPNPKDVAAVIRKVAVWRDRHIVVVGGATHSQQALLALYEQHPEIVEQVRHNPMRQSSLMPGSLSAFLFGLFSRRDPEDAHAFLTSLTDGANLEDGSPILVLRQRLEKARATRITTRHRESDTTIAAWTIKAWNAWRQGESISLLRFRPGGANPDQFPEPI